MAYPKRVKHKGKVYDINTDFRTALKCFEVINDDEISDLERSIGVVVLLFGREMPVDDEALRLAGKYLSCGVSQEEHKTRKRDMDFNQDYGYIEASFQQDYQIDLSSNNVHWWRFNHLLNGLKSDTVLSRVREIRNYDLSTLPDEKSRRQMAKAQKELALEIEEEAELTEEELESYSRFEELMGLKE